MVNEPWKQAPGVWPTKAAFFSWLRGGLRKSIWQFYPPKLEFKNESCHTPPDGYTGRAKSGTYCALTGDWTGKSKLEVDHIKGNASLTDWDDVLSFIQHLCCDKSNMQLVDKEAHKVKSYAEKWGISFELALITKKVIALEKAKQVLVFLKEKGIIPASNAKARRQQCIDILKREQQ